MTKTFAVIGDPINHSLSPTIHNAAFRELGMDCTYIAYKIAKDELEEGVESLKKINVAGFNVTIPHKVAIMKLLDKMDESASLIGAANTVSNTDGNLKGYNTDMDGFLEPIIKRQIVLKDARILLLGAGGAARAIVAAFSKHKSKEITIANRTSKNAASLAEFGTKLGIKTNILEWSELQSESAEFDFIINSTAIGLKNEASPIPDKLFTRNTTVYDIVYMPMNTDLIKRAKDKGANIIYGYEMLLGQACRAFEIWHNKQAPYDAMKKAILGGF